MRASGIAELSNRLSAGSGRSKEAAWLFTALVLTAALATALVYGAGGILAIDGSLEVGTVVALAAYLNRLYGPLIALSNGVACR